jgi:hypothetical protein
MSEFKGTPGKWAVYDDTDDGKTNRIEIVAVGKTVARIYQSNHVEDLPNARLLAAAPDLLEALQAVVRVADRATVEFDMARAAIARALGKE